MIKIRNNQTAQCLVAVFTESEHGSLDVLLSENSINRNDYCNK